MSDKRYYWLKLKNTYFSQLEQKKMKKQPNGKEMQIIYLRMLLCSLDRGGYIYYQEVYDTLAEELAEEFDEPLEIVHQTIDFLLDNNMISIDEENNCFMPEAVKCTGSEAYSTERSRRFREKKRCIETQMQQDETQCNEEKEKRDKRKEIEKRDKINYQLIADMYNEICISFPKCTKLSEKRKKAISARMKTYSEDDFRKLFEMAEGSGFLKGANSRNWTATFDWLISDTNMAKVLDGNYQDTKATSHSQPAAKPNGFHNFEQRNYNYNDLERKFINKVNGKE